MLTRTGRPVLTATVGLLLLACWLLGGWGGPRAVAVAGVVGSLAFSVFACVSAVLAARYFPGRRGLAWTITAVGLLGWVVGDLLWALDGVAVGTNPSFPSIADVAHLMMPIAVGASWIVNASGRSLLIGVRPFLDGVIIAAALFIVSWVTVLRPLLAERDTNDLQMAAALAYPVTDIVVLTMGIIVASTLPAVHRLSTGLFIAGLVAIAVSDSTGVYLGTHGVRIVSPVLVIGWSAAMVLMSAAAWTAMSMPRVQLQRTQTSNLFWMPYIPVLIGIAVAVGELWGGPPDHPILIAVVVIVIVALIRQSTVLLENRTLLTTVADQALRDPLTGLANRLLFADRLKHAMQLWLHEGRPVAVMSLDLDDFKLVNDNLGHPQGDALLVLVAGRLQSVVPVTDTLARLGGDEFAVLMEGGPHVAEVAQRIVEVFDKPFFLGGDELYIHPSVGLAAAPMDCEEIISDDELVRRADLAMYTAKRAGVGGVQSFTSDMRHIDGAELQTTLSQNGRRRRTSLAGIQLLGQLRRAIEDDALSLVYQPKISLVTGAIVGVEALIRWPHPEMGLLAPNQFLPLVRQNGLMGAVTDLVVNRAAVDAATWFHTEDCAVPVAINLFAPSLNDLSLPDGIAAALTRVGLPPHALSVEITEHLLLANITRAGTVIERLRSIGVNIAIDDFGSGYSTMSYLRDLHIDELKLDRQFIAPILRSDRAAVIVKSVIDLAHTLDIVCVAEGVEDAATATALRDYGCDIAQGHYFSHPLAADALRDTCQFSRSSPTTFPITM